MDEICRICMTSKKDLVKLVNEETKSLERSGVKFEDCFGLKITEIQCCQKICKNCELQLIDFYYFKQQAIRTHHYLLDKAVSGLGKSDVIKQELSESDEDHLSDNEDEDDEPSDVEFFNIEYLDEEAVNVDMLNVPRPMTEKCANVEIKQEKIEYEDSMEGVPSENLDEDTNYGGDNESQIEALTAEDSQLESAGVSGTQEDDRSGKDSDEELPKTPIQRFFKKSVRNLYRHKCDQCKRNFANYKTYKEHLKSHRAEDGLSVTERSDRNGKGSKGNAKRKIKFFKKSQHFKHHCKECGKNFVYDFSYEAHKNIHKGLSPYNCHLCGKGFKQKINYTYHMKNHFGERDFVCKICDKAFLVRWDLELHMRCHTDDRPFMCDICGKGFRISNHLTNHRETHNETNIYDCPMCDTKLHTRVTLKRHMASVHQVGNLKQCPFCDKQFVRIDRFKEHIRKYHENLLATELSVPKDDEAFVDVLSTE